VRSRGIECHVIIQGLPQLERKYGRTWEEILSCCDTKLVLGVKDNHTAEYVSRLIGRATVATESESYGPDGRPTICWCGDDQECAFREATLGKERLRRAVARRWMAEIEGWRSLDPAR
jgi:hypothetical protein